VSEARARIGHPHLRTHRDMSSFFWKGDTSGSEVVALSSALVLTAATIEITMVGHLRLFFDLCFVVVCLVAAVLVRPRDFFTVGVLPPLLMLGTMVLVALNGPKVIATPHDGIVQAVITGLAHHSVALFAGYAVCLATLMARQRLTPR
jgi:ATP/ADP translocase